MLASIQVLHIQFFRFSSPGTSWYLPKLETITVVDLCDCHLTVIPVIGRNKIMLTKVGNWPVNSLTKKQLDQFPTGWKMVQLGISWYTCTSASTIALQASTAKGPKLAGGTRHGLSVSGRDGGACRGLGSFRWDLEDCYGSRRNDQDALELR